MKRDRARRCNVVETTKKIKSNETKRRVYDEEEKERERERERRVRSRGKERENVLIERN